MAFSQRYAKWEQQRKMLEEIKVRRAQKAAQELLEKGSFNVSLLTLDSEAMDINSVVETAVKAVCDPVNEFLDVMRAKGLRQAEIRKIVLRLYDLYCRPFDDTSERIYEEMLEPVAMYMAQNQELYSKIDVDELP